MHQPQRNRRQHFREQQQHEGGHIEPAEPGYDFAQGHQQRIGQARHGLTDGIVEVRTDQLQQEAQKHQQQ